MDFHHNTCAMEASPPLWLSVAERRCMVDVWNCTVKWVSDVVVSSHPILFDALFGTSLTGCHNYTSPCHGYDTTPLQGHLLTEYCDCDSSVTLHSWAYIWILFIGSVCFQGCVYMCVLMTGLVIYYLRRLLFTWGLHSTFRCSWLFFINKRLMFISCCGRFKRVICFACSPGRSPACCDHEIIMMNHVYKERFPKVNGWNWRCLASQWSGHIDLASVRWFLLHKWGSSPGMTGIKQHHSLLRERENNKQMWLEHLLRTQHSVWWMLPVFTYSRVPGQCRKRLCLQRPYILSTLRTHVPHLLRDGFSPRSHGSLCPEHCFPF